MIKCWFDETGYRISGNDIKASMTLESCDESDQYTTRWYVFGLMLDTLLAGGALREEIKIYNDSRLVEELNGLIEPLTDYGSQSRRYHLMHDRPKLPKITVHKTSRNKINMAIAGEREGSEQAT